MVVRLRRLGIEVESSMTAEELVSSLREERPEIASIVHPIVRTYLLETFSRHRPSEEMLSAARSAMARLREIEA